MQATYSVVSERQPIAWQMPPIYIAPEAASWSSRPCSGWQVLHLIYPSGRLNPRATHIQGCSGQPSGGLHCGLFHREASGQPRKRRDCIRVCRRDGAGRWIVMSRLWECSRCGKGFRWPCCSPDRALFALGQSKMKGAEALAAPFHHEASPAGWLQFLLAAGHWLC